MSFSFHSRQFLRPWAAALAVVWLLAVATNVAHACIVGFASQPATQEASMSHGHDGSAPSKSDCQDYCEKTSLASSAKTTWDTPAGHIALPQAESRLSVAVADVEAVAPATAMAPQPGAPVFIRFLRLAL